jgi:putative membrane protein
MGGADIIPGVSGGTVALIVGIYQRLVTAISRFDLQLLRYVRRGEFKAAVEHVDLRFLVALGCGILAGVFGLARLMHFLLNNYFEATWSVFFGLILASGILVARLVKPWNRTNVLCCIGGAAFAFWLVGNLPAVAPSGNAYVLLCGLIGISAMILPGISGSFILLLMGKYADIIGAVSSLTDGTATRATLLTLAVFATGCALGLLGFSKVLRWLLTRHEPATMAVLCGFLFGSLRKIWPFKQDLTLDFLHVYGLSPSELKIIQSEPERLGEFVKITRRIYANVWPQSFDAQVATYLALAVGAMAFVFVLDRLSRGREHAQYELEHPITD